jgi:endonuclease-3 related protein
MEMYQACLARFGHQGWWPGQTPLEVCVGAILTQNTNWTNVEKALVNLRAASCLSLGRLAQMPAPALAEFIKPAGYFNVKAKRLKNFVSHVYASFGEDLAAFLGRPISVLREDLLSVSGIGRETADSIILYGALLPAFVVDAYTYRIMLRHGLISREDDYEAIKEFFETNLPADAALYNDFHAQLVAVGKNYCRPVARCEGCPLEPFGHDRNAGSED